MFTTSFDTEEKEFRQRKTAWAAIITLLVHGLILLLLFFTILHTPIPPFEDNAGGMAVNFGFDEVGSGETQPFSYNPGPMETSQEAGSATPEKSTPDEVLSQENGEEAVVVPKAEEKPKVKPDENAMFKPNKNPSTNKTTTSKPNKTENPAPAQQPNKDALFTKGAYGEPNKSVGDGTGGGQGDQGKPNGDPNSKNYLGDGNGDGQGPGSGDLNGGYSLAGRKKLSLPAPQTCTIQGKVVIKIKVDRSGKVVAADFERFKSTTFDKCNIDNALAAAKKSTFNAVANAPETQEGTITYIYKVH